jgi:NAD/NADP transhydrogenase beta subunit
MQCGYDLAGLPKEGQGPECSTSVRRSLLGNSLEYCSPDYLRTLHHGVILAQTSIIMLVLQILAGGLFRIVLASVVAQTAMFDLVGSMVGFVGSIIGLVGWWMLSALDPRFTGVDTGQRSRAVVRVTVAALAGITLLQLVLAFFSTAVSTFAAADPLILAILGVSAFGLIAQITKYFASLIYLQWLVRRIPNQRAEMRARLLMWLGPVLVTVGALLLFIGPLVAIVLYYNMLDWVRKDLKRIRSDVSASSGL